MQHHSTNAMAVCCSVELQVIKNTVWCWVYSLCVARPYFVSLRL
jgi:hypothetical protein